MEHATARGHGAFIYIYIYGCSKTVWNFIYIIELYARRPRSGPAAADGPGPEAPSTPGSSSSGTLRRVPSVTAVAAAALGLATDAGGAAAARRGRRLERSSDLARPGGGGRLGAAARAVPVTAGDGGGVAGGGGGGRRRGDAAERILFCGWRRDMAEMIRELDADVPPGR
jgi:hypothetical protein